jgi:hypothetical protein
LSFDHRPSSVEKAINDRRRQSADRRKGKEKDRNEFQV